MVAVFHVLAADLPDVADTLGQAFVDDPVWGRWIFGDTPNRLESVTAMFRLFATAALKTGHLYMASGHEAVAHWVPPDVEMMSQTDVAEIDERLGALLGSEFGRVLAGFEALEAAQPRDVPYFYLVALATRPEHQNRGFGSQLIRHVLDQCDTQGIPAYLRSSNPRNVSLYRRHGFLPIGDIRLPDGPSEVAMWRQPHSLHT
jgi:ribosomal protein S18 acetylase RimI-like enzyme